jgi:hypothetical protein
MLEHPKALSTHHYYGSENLKDFFLVKKEWAISRKPNYYM